MGMCCFHCDEVEWNRLYHPPKWPYADSDWTTGGLWFHGPEESWERLKEQEGMPLFARSDGSILRDVRGRTCLDVLSVVNAC